MTRRHESQLNLQNDEPVCVMTAHQMLLECSVGEQLGPLAEFIVHTLGSRGPLTLKELADVVKREPFNNPVLSGGATKHVRSPIALPVSAGGDIAVDAAIKELMARLLLHRVVRWDAESHTYRIALGYGLFLRTLFPLVVRFFQRRYGETGVTLLMVFYQLATVPWEAALRLAIERRPALSEALRHCAREMEQLGLIEFVSSNPSASSSTPTATDPCRLNVGNILAEMLRHAIQHQLLAERFADGGAIAVSIMEAFTVPSRTRRLEERPHGFPPVHPRTSTSLQLRTLLRDVPFAENAILETVSRMCRPDGDNLLSNDGTASTSNEGPYRFRYDAAVDAMRRDCCERIVFARHGVLGVRLIKLLIQHHNMEDRMLAEEAIATLHRTREVLHAMMRDGYVRQQEVPKSGVMADRQPKNSTFLWSCSMERELLPTVRVQVSKSLRIALTRLAMERRTAACPSSAAAASATGTAGGAPPVNETARSQRAVLALESSATALMEMMLVLDFY